MVQSGMKFWAPLLSSLVDSSIWEEPDHVFRLFMAMLTLKDMDHVVRYDSYKLARRIHMDPIKVLDALKVLSSPDTRRTEQEYQGRRIKAVDDGWLVLNGEKYKRMAQDELKRYRLRRAQQAWRDRQKRGKPLPGEMTAEKLAKEHGPEAAEQYQDRAFQ